MFDVCHEYIIVGKQIGMCLEPLPCKGLHATEAGIEEFYAAVNEYVEELESRYRKLYSIDRGDK